MVHRRFRNLVTPRTPGGQIKVTNEPSKPRQANQFSRPFEAEPAPEAATLGFEHGDPRPRTGVVPGGTRTTRRHCGGYRGQRFRGQHRGPSRRVRIRRRTHGWLGGRRRHWGKRNGLCVGRGSKRYQRPCGRQWIHVGAGGNDRPDTSIGCQRKRSGNMRRVQVPRTVSRSVMILRIPSCRIMHGSPRTATKLPTMSVESCPIPGGCTTCRAMSGNGARIFMLLIPAVPLRTPEARLPARTG